MIVVGNTELYIQTLVCISIDKIETKHKLTSYTIICKVNTVVKKQQQHPNFWMENIGMYH